MPANSFNGILCGANKYGRWIPEREIYAQAFMGGSTIDFSHAIFIEPVITIHAKAMWGGITIIVPPGVILEEDLGGLFGGSGGSCHRVASAQDIVMKISGTSVMGDISTVVNPRAEPARLVTPGEAARIMREPPKNANELDVVRSVLGGVFGDLAGGAAANLRTAAPAPGAQQPTHNASATQNGQHIPGAAAVSPSVVVQGIPAQELKNMKALLDEGILTQEEFDAQKKRVLMQVRS